MKAIDRDYVFSIETVVGATTFSNGDPVNAEAFIRGMTRHASAAAQAQKLPAGFVYLRDIDPTIIQDMRYAGANNFVGRPLTRMLGYMPGKAGLGMDLPKDAFLQWVGWVMSPRYLFDDARLDALQNFPNYRGALRALCMADDPWATRPAVELLCAGFTSIKPEIITVRPADARTEKIGHLGFFKSEHRDTLWRGAAEWIEAGQ